MKAHRKLHFGNEGYIANTRSSYMKCNECSKTFKSGSSLKRHLREQHNVAQEVFKCETCDHVFRRVDHLKNHLKVHTQKSRPVTIEANKFMFNSTIPITIK